MSTMKAVVAQEGKTLAVVDHPVPELDANDVLVRVKAIAQNPTDWKYPSSGMAQPGHSCGCDFAGVVERVGAGPLKKNVKVGDRVAGFTHGGAYTDRGAFAELVKLDSDLVWQLPESVSFEGAATMGCSYWTAAQGLFNRLGLTEPPAKAVKPEWVFIYGGSTSVGQFAIQLASAAGYRVVTTASPHNHELVKSLGAELAFDYRSATVSEDIRKATDDSIRFGLDTISEGDSQPISVKAFGRQGGNLCTILPVDEKAASLRPDVKIAFTLIYTALGRTFDFGPMHFPASPADRDQAAQIMLKTPDFVKAGLVKSNKIKLLPGGLAAVLEGMNLLRNKKVSGEKIVHTL